MTNREIKEKLINANQEVVNACLRLDGLMAEFGTPSIKSSRISYWPNTKECTGAIAFNKSSFTLLIGIKKIHNEDSICIQIDNLLNKNKHLVGKCNNKGRIGNTHYSFNFYGRENMALSKYNLETIRELLKLV